MSAEERAILDRLTTAIRTAFGDRITRLVLFGSRARGDARPESDYDVAVFLRDFSGHISREGFILADITHDILLETGAFITALPFAENAHLERTPLMHEIRREGIDL